MSDISVQIAELERQASLAGRYFGKLEEAWGRSAEAKESLKKLEIFLTENQIETGLLKVFSEGPEPGVVYVELPRGARDFHGQAAQLLLECCLSELTQKNDAAWGKWREFGQNIYYGIIEELYGNFVSSKAQLALVFELAYRQLMLEAAQAWWDGQPESAKEMRPAIDRRLGLEITGLLRPLREKLLANKRIDLGILEKLADIGWEAPVGPEGAQAKEMACLLHDHHLTSWMLSEIFYMLYTEQLKAEEEMVWEKLNSTTFSKPEDVLAAISGKLPRVSELAAKEILKLVVKRGQEMELRISNELSELLRFIARLKKQAQELVEKNNGEMAKTMEAKLSNESLITLSAKVSDNLIQFQRNLFAQLWQIGDMERKEKNLHGSLEKARYLQKMQIKELMTMLSEKTSDPSTDLRQHLSQFKLYSLHIDHKWEDWAQQHAKELMDLFRQAGEEAKGRAAVLERDLQKKNPKDPAFGQLKLELRRAQDDFKALEGLVEEKDGGRLYHVEKIILGYRKFLRDSAEPLMFFRRISQLVRLWPPLVAKDPPLMRQQEFFDEVRFLNDSLKNTSSHCIMAAQGKVCSQPQLLGENIRQLRSRLQKRCGKNIAVMVYDIRGSSFMSAKLNNAEKEREIKNKLGYMITQVIKQHGGMLVKDTGDGGLAWFGENGPELYEKCFKDLAGLKGIRMRHSIASGGELPMQPSSDSGRLACECGVQMLKTAEKFIQDNYTNYREWFKEAKEREILHEGMNYAVLPPEFKALFRLGVGIASGEPGREITLSFNAAGDIDLCGTLVNDASLLATGRDPMRSLIIVDQGTCFNLLLNTERFEPAYQKSFESGKISGPEAWESSLWEAYNMAGSVLPDGNYYFPAADFEVQRIGIKRAIRNEAQKGQSLQFGSISGSVLVGEEGCLYQAEDRSELRLIYELKPNL
jgi:class 3 adenylate cyclase